MTNFNLKIAKSINNLFQLLKGKIEINSYGKKGPPRAFSFNMFVKNYKILCYRNYNIDLRNSKGKFVNNILLPVKISLRNMRKTKNHTIIKLVIYHHKKFLRDTKISRTIPIVEKCQICLFVACVVDWLKLYTLSG